MDERCCSPTNATERAPITCTTCQTTGQPVDELTVKALLTDVALRRFEQSAYRFCPDPSCEVVYFDQAGRTFIKQDIRVPVWQKESLGNRMICYCFDENEAEIAQEIRETGASHAVERVRGHIAAHRCACEVRNPRGVCCLGDLIAAVERAREQ